MLRSEAGCEDSPQSRHRGRGREAVGGRRLEAVGGWAAHNDHLLGAGLLSVGQGGDLIVLQRHGGERLGVAGVVSLDVFGEVTLVAEPLEAGTE